MAKQYFVQLFIRNQREELMFEVRESESNRLAASLYDLIEVDELDVFWFNSVDGRSVLVNLADVQAAGFIWEASRGSSDLLRSEGAIEIQLRGRRKVLQAYAENPEEVYRLFADLEIGDGLPAFHGFTDVDGEPLILNGKEVVWIAAPQQVVEQGREMAAKADGLEDET
jgi:hypothetical protein